MTPRPLSAIQANTGVIVVHGLDPATLSAKAQAEKSDLVPALAARGDVAGTLWLRSSRRRRRRFRPAARQPAAVARRSSDETTLLIVGGALLAGAVTMLGVRQLAPKRISDNS